MLHQLLDYIKINPIRALTNSTYILLTTQFQEKLNN